MSDPQANHFHMEEFNAVLQVEQAPRGKWDGTLGGLDGSAESDDRGAAAPRAQFPHEAAWRIRLRGSTRRGRDPNRGRGALRLQCRSKRTRTWISQDSMFETLDVSRTKMR